MRLVFVAPLLIAAAAVASAQSSAPLAFEVASIRRVEGPRQGASMNFLPGGRFVASNQPIYFVLRLAFPTNGGDAEGVPEWAVTERYDISAIAGRDATIPELREMLRALLVQRFNLQSHLEDREVPIYALVLGPANNQLGPNLKRSSLDCTAIAAAQRRGGPLPSFTPPSNGAPPCGMTQGGPTVRGAGVPMTLIASSLTGAAGRVVVDRTGLTGNWEFTLTRATQPPGIGGEPLGDAPSVFTAVQEQLGLKLEPSRGTVQVLVVDHIERPAEN